MPKRDVIVVGTSAGGLEALKSLVSQLPANLAASVFIVWHMPADQPSFMPQILERHSALPVVPVSDCATIQPGTIYVVTPDHHLVLESSRSMELGEPGQMRVTHGPRENMFRPSIDVLFRSAARAFGPRVIGVVLTGMLDDGASGLYSIKAFDGVAVVQDPVDAMFPDMPISAMKAVKVDHSVSIAEMGQVLVQLVNDAAAQELQQAATSQHDMDGGHAVAEKLDAEVRVAMEDKALEMGVLGEPSMYACPECHGVLTQIKEGPLLRFRCHTGHAYTMAALLSGITGSVEDSLWSAIRALEESEMLMTHMAQHLRDAGHAEAAENFAQKVQQAQQRAELVRQAVLSTQVINADEIAHGSP
jgi:two-component system chemotaxis response regulator CheB